MKMIICSTGERYRRCGFGFTRDGAPFTLVDRETDDPVKSEIGTKTYEILKGEAKAGRISMMPEAVATMLASPDSALAKIQDLEAQLAAAHDRISELEAQHEAHHGAKHSKSK